MQRHFLLAYVSLAALLAGSGCGRLAAEQPPSGEGGTPKPLTCAPEAGAELRQAMFTIYYEGQRLTLSDAVAASIPPTRMSIEHAAKVVRDQESPQFDTRRRHAISFLAARGSPPDGVGASWTPPLVGDAMKTILGEVVLEEFTKRFLADDRFRVTAGMDSRQAYVRQRWAAETILDDLAREDVYTKAARRCCVCKLEYDADPPFALSAGRGMARFRASVKGPDLDTMRRVVDPRSWPCCHGQYFETVDILRAPECDAVEDVEACGSDAPESTKQPIPQGSVWSGVVYERFRTQFESDGGECPDENNAEIRDLLDVVTTFEDGTYRIDYGLCRSIDHTIGCDECEEMGLVEDCGYVSVARAVDDLDTPIEVNAVKYLEYSDPQSHPELILALPTAMIELIDISVDEGLCCGYADGGTCESCYEPTSDEEGDPPGDLCR